ncbi:MAG: SDR family NAD(P)-dependent oxidoreductase [Ignavibacteriota bacterium]
MALGARPAVLMAREGAKVMASARRKERLETLQKEMAAEGHTLATFVADATDPAQMNALAEAARQKFGPIQILVYATGTNTLDRAMTRLNPTVWNELITTNLNGAYYATQAVVPAMRQAKFGHIIYISSISGHTPDVSGAAYQASKRGMIGLSHAVRLEEKENGIRTTVINPGLVDTEILEKRPVKPPAEMLAQALVPEHVAEVVLACAKLPPRAVVTEMSIVPSAL